MIEIRLYNQKKSIPLAPSTTQNISNPNGKLKKWERGDSCRPEAQRKLRKVAPEKMGDGLNPQNELAATV
ncbi:F-box protein [Corchorus olitorius]|uniref:F-box protein n=1 Tax=Corchorus olitorius TaxID=93759 RepID=A0A1R3GF50_9ROSI|nr:F-box protein [Corchorus olitorius]